MEEYGQEIDLLVMLNEVLRKWWLMLILVLVFGYGSYYYTTNYIVPIYEAKSTLFIGKETGALATLSLGDLQLGDQLVGDYSQLIKTRLVTGEVIKELGLSTMTEDLVKNLNITIIPDTRFIYISFKDPIPERAELIVNKLSEILAEKAELVIGVKNVMIIDEAIIPTESISPNIITNTAIAGIVGLMIALFLIFVAVVLNDKIQTEEEIESLVGIPVIGIIPKFKEVIHND